MADVASQFSDNFDAFTLTPDPQDAIEPYYSPPPDLFRPTLADDQKIGFFSLDRNTQTDVTEIVDIKELTDTVHMLLDDAGTMRRDINFARSVMQADFDNKLQTKAIELYVRVNDKIGDIEKMHAERVSTVRRAFKQQLTDAIARVHNLYTRNFADRLQREQTRQEVETGKMGGRVNDLQGTIQRNEMVINTLKQQIEELKERERQRDIADQLQSEQTITPPGTPTWVKDEKLAELKHEINNLENRAAGLEDQLNSRDNLIDDLNGEVGSLNEQLEQERVIIEQMKLEREELTQNVEKNRQSSQQSLDATRLQMEKQYEEKLKQAREEALAEAQSQFESIQSSEHDRMKQLMEEKRMAEQMLAKERSKQSERSQDQLELDAAQRAEQKLRAEVAKLKKEIDRVHRTWEKKFAILQQSLHALKDESFLRQTMQRQAATLHQAAISYAYDSPTGIVPSNKKPTIASGHGSAKKHFTEASKGGPSNPGHPKSPADYISYTVSAPSGRCTTVLSIDENQVMSDNEQDFPTDCVPLPQPPSRPGAEDAEDSRPSTRSHVVVLPSVHT